MSCVYSPVSRNHLQLDIKLWLFNNILAHSASAVLYIIHKISMSARSLAMCVLFRTIHIYHINILDMFSLTNVAFVAKHQINLIPNKVTHHMLIKNPLYLCWRERHLENSQIRI